MCMRVERNKEIQIADQFDDNITKNVRIHFKLEKENKAIKNRINKDITNLFEHEGDHYKQTGVRLILNKKETVIEIKYYQSENVLTKLSF